MARTRTMSTFTQSTTLEYIVNDILEASASSAPFRQAIRAAGAKNVTDFMMIEISDFKSTSWTITTGTGDAGVRTVRNLNAV